MRAKRGRRDGLFLSQMEPALFKLWSWQVYFQPQLSAPETLLPRQPPAPWRTLEQALVSLGSLLPQMARSDDKDSSVLRDILESTGLV